MTTDSLHILFFVIIFSVVHGHDIYLSGLYASPVVENIQKEKLKKT